MKDKDINMRKSLIKFLGVMVDEKMNWKDHKLLNVDTGSAIRKRIYNPSVPFIGHQVLKG